MIDSKHSSGKRPSAPACKNIENATVAAELWREFDIFSVNDNVNNDNDVNDQNSHNAGGTSTKSTRPQRDRHQPNYLEDFIVPTQSYRPRPTQSQSYHSSVRSSSRSSSSNLSRVSERSEASVLSQLSAFQAAKLKENRQINTLIELTYQIKEDEETDAHLRMLDDSAYAARRQVEDTRLRAEDLERNTLFEREALTSKLSRLRKLRRAEQNLQDAKLISYFLSQEPVEHSASLDLVKNIKEPEAHLIIILHQILIYLL